MKWLFLFLFLLCINSVQSQSYQHVDTCKLDSTWYTLVYFGKLDSTAFDVKLLSFKTLQQNKIEIKTTLHVVFEGHGLPIGWYVYIRRNK